MEMRIVLADDSELMLTRLKGQLSTNKQIEIVGAFNNGTDTLEALKSLKPDLAIVDIKMPGLNGLEVLQEIRKENEIIKIIILSFYTNDYHRKMALKLGADYFFNKADDFDKVLPLIQNMILSEENKN